MLAAATVDVVRYSREVRALIWIVTARETLDSLMSMKFLFGTLLCLTLVVISTVVSLQDYQSRMDEYESAIAEFNEKPDIFNVRIYRKPEVLSIFARGFERRFGNMAQTGHSGATPIQAGGLSSRAPLSLVFIVPSFSLK